MTTLRFGGYQGDASVHTRGGRALAEAVRRESGGAVRLDFDENITRDGRKAADLLSMTEAGELDGCYFSSSYLAGRVPELGIFDLHFEVPDRRAAYALLDGELGGVLRDRVADATGLCVMGFWDNGMRHISSRDPIRRVEDCRGLRLRTLASDDHQRVFRALGFEPVAIDVRDLPEACRSGQVDAQENPLTNIWNFGLHRHHRHILLTGHLLGVALCLFNAQRVASWCNDLRAAIQRAVDQATAAQRGFAEAEDALCTRALCKDGVEIAELPAAERDRFAAAARPEVDAIRARLDPALAALFDRGLGHA